MTAGGPWRGQGRVKGYPHPGKRLPRRPPGAPGKAFKGWHGGCTSYGYTSSGDTDDRDPKGGTVFFAIVKKELRNHLASFRFWVGALLTIVLAYSSTLV